MPTVDIMWNSTMVQRTHSSGLAHKDTDNSMQLLSQQLMSSIFFRTPTNVGDIKFI